MNLVRLVYVSDAVKKFNKPELATLLQRSQANNARRDVTGLLLYSANHFIQVLEGPADQVNERYLTIAADIRHNNVQRLLCEVTRDRLFPKWSMGLLESEKAPTLDRTAVLRVIRHGSNPLEPTDRTQVHKLLQNFSEQMAA